MKATRILVALSLWFAHELVHGQTQPVTGKAIPFAQLGAEAQKQYSGDGIGILPTKDGATIRATFQRLEGQVTAEGLWLTSTADEDKGKDTRFRVRAMALRRKADTPVCLTPQGETFATKQAATWLRPGLLEEYTASMDGIRQDFVVPVRPPGEGELAVSLELTRPEHSRRDHDRTVQSVAKGRGERSRTIPEPRSATPHESTRRGQSAPIAAQRSFDFAQDDQ